MTKQKSITFREFEYQLKRLRVKGKFVKNLTSKTVPRPYDEQYGIDSSSLEKYYKSIIKLLNHPVTFYELIQWAFWWERTSEGHKFWDRISVP